MRLFEQLNPSVRLLLLLILVVSAPRAASAQQLTLTWDPSTSPEATGYMVYVGTTSGVYASTYNVGSNRSFILTNVQAGRTYYFAVGAFSADGAVGSLSAEISGAIGTAATAPPTTTSPSPDGTEIPTNASQIRDNGLAVWTISSGRVMRNGVQAAGGLGSVLLWRSSTIYVFSLDFNWWRWTGSGWTNVGSTTPGAAQAPSTPVPSPTPGPSSGTERLTLMWDPSPSSSVAGYRVHVGTAPGSYASVYDVGNVVSYVVENLVAGRQYYFSVNAYAPGPVEGSPTPEISGFSNGQPVLTNPGGQASIVGMAVSLQLVASDPAGSPVTYSASGLPPGLSIVSSTGRISGTPTTAGSYAVTARASDGALIDSEAFTWSVTTSNGPPVMTNPGSRTSMVGTAATLQLVAVDPNGTAVTFTVTGLPPGLTTSPSGWITGTPTTAGAYTVTARASDGTLVDTESFTWTATANNAAPELTNPGTQTNVTGASVSLQLIANDPNGSPLSFLVTGLPAGLTMASTGRVSGTPTTAGTYAVTATASDGLLVDVERFTWTVTSAPVNDTRRPTVTISVPTRNWSFQTTSAFVTIGGTATDDTEVVEVTWVNDTGGSGRATGTYNWIATVPLMTGVPWNMITVTARDRAGRTATRSLWVSRR